MLHPIFQIARRNRREEQWSLSANDARLWCDETPTPPLWPATRRERTRRIDKCGRRQRGSGERLWRGDSQHFAGRTNGRSTRRAARPFGGNRSGAIGLTAVRQGAAVHVRNESNPAGHNDSGVTKDCGALGDEADEAGTPPDKGRDESSYPQPNRLERACCLTTCVDNGESLVRDCSLNPQQCHNGAGRDPNFGLVRGAKDDEADPHRASRFVRIRGQDAFDTINLCRTLQDSGKFTNPTTAKVERALAPWNATAHSIKRGALRHAAQIVETYNLNPHVISQLADTLARSNFFRILFDIWGGTPHC
ncbi:hypothetical protein TcYC6_0050460 [Trypanosoma cruzi]|nr:hypothetical protein TcYC6_0050460 [Trypanosoma cruzi]